MASLYLRGYIYWMKTYRTGRMIRTSLRTRDKAEARRRLREREAQMVHGDINRRGTITWDTASQDLLVYYRAYGTRDPVNAGYRLAHLNRYFGATKLVDIDAAAILGYVTHRKAQGRANATINVELATLRRALRLAQEYGKLDKVPVIRMLKPAQPRNGFFEREQFEAVAQALPADLALVARIGYVYGWRLRSEVLTLTKDR